MGSFGLLSRPRRCRPDWGISAAVPRHFYINFRNLLILAGRMSSRTRAIAGYRHDPLPHTATDTLYDVCQFLPTHARACNALSPTPTTSSPPVRDPGPSRLALFNQRRGRRVLRSSPYNHSRKLGAPESIERAGVAEPRPWVLGNQSAAEKRLSLRFNCACGKGCGSLSVGA